MKPFSVYVHVPYCARKCPYCDFNVHVVRTIPEDRYRDALLREIDAAGKDPSWAGRRVKSVFFGGGTPSLFRARTFAGLVDRIDKRFGIEPGAEVSLEANPEDIVAATPEELRALRNVGVNRLTLGVQSFEPRHLRTLGRLHRADDAERSVERARAAGFDNIAVDLIFAVPGQSTDDWQRDLERTIALVPQHVSTYGLTYEEGTSLARRRAAGRVEAVAEDDERAMYEAAIDALSAAGYRHYEISNFAHTGFESSHNLAYWTWADYLGLGAGAHGFARYDPPFDGTWGVRYENTKPPDRYMDLSPAARSKCETLDEEMAISEFLMLGIRRVAGFEEREFEHTFARRLDDVTPSLEALLEAGLLTRNEGHIALTRQGLLLADSVTARLADVRLPTPARSTSVR